MLERSHKNKMLFSRTLKSFSITRALQHNIIIFYHNIIIIRHIFLIQTHHPRLRDIITGPWSLYIIIIIYNQVGET